MTLRIDNLLQTALKWKLTPEMANESQTLLENEQEIKSAREIELEEMLMGLKDTFSSL